MFRASLLFRAKDPFKVLGLARSASKPEVKAKYRDLAKQYHPDNTLSGDAKLMEEINRAYNLLLKEGAYERLHTKALSQQRSAAQPYRGPQAASPASTAGGSESVPSSSSSSSSSAAAFGGRKPPMPFDGTGMDQEPDDYAKMSGLDPETERLTPEGLFLYQNRETGEWMSMDQPLIRTERRHYGSFAKQQSDEVYHEIRAMMAKNEAQQAKRTAAQRMRDHCADTGNLPFKDGRLLLVCAFIALMGFFLAYRRTFSLPVHKRVKRSWYSELRDNKTSFDELYDEVKDDVDLSVAAASMIFLAALEKKSLSDDVVAPVPESYYNTTVPPRSHWAINPGV